MKIRYDSSILERFKKVARKRAPLEYLELLFGRAGEEEIEILRAVTVKHTATLSTDDDQAIEELDSNVVDSIKLKMSQEGLEWLGDIHSHPDHADNVPSSVDNENALEIKAKVFGIYNFSKKSGRCQSRVCFYIAQRPQLLERAS